MGTILHLLAANARGAVRRATLDGAEHVVVPMTMIVPGVLPGSKGPLYYSARELARTAAGWNGVPITAKAHPTDDAGRHVSAQSPGVLEEYGIGTVRNAGVRPRDGALVAEAWLDVARLKKKYPSLLRKIERGDPVNELSTGLFTRDVPVQNGRCPRTGRAYTHEVRVERQDHLAVLESEPGACSLKDGCGLGVNAAAGLADNLWTEAARAAAAVARRLGRKARVKIKSSGAGRAAAKIVDAKKSLERRLNVIADGNTAKGRPPVTPARVIRKAKPIPIAKPLPTTRRVSAVKPPAVAKFAPNPTGAAAATSSNGSTATRARPKSRTGATVDRHLKAAASHRENAERLLREKDFAGAEAARRSAAKSLRLARRRLAGNSLERDEMAIDRAKAVKFLTTNCDCWKGDAGKKVLDGLSDDQLRAVRDGVALETRALNAYHEATGKTEVDRATLNEFVANAGKPKTKTHETEDGGLEKEDATPGGKPTGNAGNPFAGMSDAQVFEILPKNIQEVVANGKKAADRARAEMIGKLVANMGLSGAAADKHAAKFNKLSADELEELVADLPPTRNSANPFLSFDGSPVPGQDADDDPLGSGGLVNRLTRFGPAPGDRAGPPAANSRGGDPGVFLDLPDGRELDGVPTVNLSAKSGRGRKAVDPDDQD